MSRKEDVAVRLRKQLRRKRESLADQFEFRMYIAFVPKDPHKSVLFQAAEVLPVMTNNYEESILRGAQEENYSLESSLELLEKDVVQLHAQRYFSLREDVLGEVVPMSFFLWPRTDVTRMACFLFSRWKGDANAPFKPLNADFEFLFDDYERQLYRFMLVRKDKKGIIINNPLQSMFLFIDRGFMDLPTNKTTFFKLTSVCLYLPQDQLTNWGPGTEQEILEPFKPLRGVPPALSLTTTSSSEGDSDAPADSSEPGAGPRASVLSSSSSSSAEAESEATRKDEATERLNVQMSEAALVDADRKSGL